MYRHIVTFFQRLLSRLSRQCTRAIPYKFLAHLVEFLAVGMLYENIDLPLQVTVNNYIRVIRCQLSCVDGKVVVILAISTIYSFVQCCMNE